MRRSIVATPSEQTEHGGSNIGSFSRLVIANRDQAYASRSNALAPADEKAVTSQESIEMSTRLYVGNLSFNSNADSIREAFTQFGEVTDVHVVMDRETGRSRGFAFVTMGTPQEAQSAIATMNGALLDGRPLRVNEAEARQPRGGGGFGGGGGGGGGFGGGGDKRRGGGERRDRW